MPDREPDRYVVKVVFRGLFLARVHEGEGARVEVLLPEASEPGQLLAAASGSLQSQLRRLQPLREHHAILEFHVADWDNRSARTPGLIAVSKPNKEPVGMFFVRGRRLRFQGLWDRETFLPPDLVEDPTLYEPLTEQLRVLQRHTEHGFDQLPGFTSEPAANAASRSAAATEFTVGEVYTERRSRLGQQPRQWEHLLVSEFRRKPDRARARMFNLDLVVRFALPVTNPLLIVCEPLAGAAEQRHFILAPSDARRGLTVWVKNRELSATLTDSDLVPDPFVIDCPDVDEIDRDHGYYMTLAADPDRVAVPRDLNRDASDCAGGCGGCGFPPPRP